MSDTLVVALSDEPTNLNPIFGDLYGSIYGDHWPIFSSLLDYDRQLELTPDLATALPEVSADGLTVTVPLREGVLWHDGKPFTAEDVVFTYRAFLDPTVATSLREELYDTVTAVDALDARTVRSRSPGSIPPSSTNRPWASSPDTCWPGRTSTPHRSTSRRSGPGLIGSTSCVPGRG